VDLEVLVKPLVNWIWYGGLILALGSLIGLWPSADRRRSGDELPVQEPAAAGAV